MDGDQLTYVRREVTLYISLVSLFYKQDFDSTPLMKALFQGDERRC